MKNRENKIRNQKEESRYAFFAWIFLMLMLIGADIGLYFLGSELAVRIVGICITVFFGLIGILISIAFYRDCVKPSKTGVESADSTLKLREAQIHKRKKGKDMYEIVDHFRREYFYTLFFVIGISMFLLTCAGIIKLNQYDSIHIPFYWSIIGTIIIMLISVAITYKIDFVFLTSGDLKKEIKKRGFDEVRVNNDFMMASYHYMFKGIMAIGSSYYVVFMQHFCRVGEVRKITKIETYSENRKLNNVDYTRYFIKIYEGKNSVSLMCSDEVALDLIVSEFVALGYEVTERGNKYLEVK